MCDFFLGGGVLWKDMGGRLGVPPLVLQLALLYREIYTKTGVLAGTFYNII